MSDTNIVKFNNMAEFNNIADTIIKVNKQLQYYYQFKKYWPNNLSDVAEYPNLDDLFSSIADLSKCSNDFKIENGNIFLIL